MSIVKPIEPEDLIKIMPNIKTSSDFKYFYSEGHEFAVAVNRDGELELYGEPELTDAEEFALLSAVTGPIQRVKDEEFLNREYEEALAKPQESRFFNVAINTILITCICGSLGVGVVWLLQSN